MRGGTRRNGENHAVRVVHCEVTLPPARESARAARRLLREALTEAAREEWLDDAELALSEVVTNAMLHAHSDIEVAVDVTQDELCVEVRDYDRALPVQRHYGDEAVTGRGMALVAAITRAHGVRQLADGKVVWFCIGGRPSSADGSVDDLVTAWAIDLDDDLPPPPAIRTVVLRDMPVALWLAAREHHDAMIRELCHWIAEHGQAASVDVAGADRARSTVSGTLSRVLGRHHGDDTRVWPERTDLVLDVAPDGARAFEALQDTLDFGESLALDGKLLIQPALPEIVAVRDWVCEQAIAQLLDVDPNPWPGTAQERFETEVRDHRAAKAEWDDSVTGAAGAVVAADAANRIIAVSDGALDLLGWDRDELVGRRVVTIVPPAWRERHVAGFSRNVSTGEMTILGDTLELPVLRADGSEVSCRVRIDRLSGSGQRMVYAAWFEPAG